jgi:N-acetylglucosamine-6-sulfatase
VHPDAFQAADGTLDLENRGGYRAAERHKDLYKGCVFPKTPNMLPPAEVVKQKPVWAEAFELKKTEKARALLDSLHAGKQEEIRLRAAMMASVEEGVGMLFEELERSRQLDHTLILFLGDNGYFFGEHALGPERRFAYEEGIRSPFTIRFPPLIKKKARVKNLVICQDIAPTLIELAGGTPGPQIQGRSLIPLFSGKRLADWRKSFLIEYWAEQALPWLVGMTYKAVRTDRYKYVHWVNRGRAGELDELYDLERDRWELKNLIASPKLVKVRADLKREMRRLLGDATAI